MIRPLAFACALALAGAGPAGAKTMTIKLGSLAPEGTIYHEALQIMAESWRKSSNGAIAVKVYPGGVAGDEGDMVRKMRVGQLQAAAVTAGGLADISPEVRAMQLPLMLDSYEEFEYVRDRLRPRFDGPLEARGFKVLGWGDAGWLRFFSQSPVIHPDDMKSLKMFVWTVNSTYIEAWKDMGYQPVPMAATDIHIGLASKLINVTLVPPIAALSFQWFTLANHMTDLNFVCLPVALVIDRKVWASIEEPLRPALQKGADEAMARLKGARALNDEAVGVMREHGLKVHAVPPEARKAWEALAKRGYPRMIADGGIPTDLVAEVERLRSEYRARRVSH